MSRINYPGKSDVFVYNDGIVNSRRITDSTLSNVNKSFERAEPLKEATKVTPDMLKRIENIHFALKNTQDSLVEKLGEINMEVDVELYGSLASFVNLKTFFLPLNQIYRVVSSEGYTFHFFYSEGNSSIEISGMKEKASLLNGVLSIPKGYITKLTIITGNKWYTT